MEYVKLIFFFGALALLASWIAIRQGFYTFALGRAQVRPLPLKSVLVVFAIYLGITVFFAPLLVRLIHVMYSAKGVSVPYAIMGWIQVLVLSVVFLLLYLFSRTQDPSLMKKIWKDSSVPNSKPIMWDAFLGVITWLISFPLVTVIGQCADMLLYYWFGFEQYEQVAVRYLKMSLQFPDLLASALFAILIAAPIIEEFLFRGFLQTYLKKHFTVKTSIALASMCFALFHLSPSQGLGNFSLVIALFTFSLFLGFIYERQASLFASIGLHMAFNTFSTIRILFLPEG